MSNFFTRLFGKPNSDEIISETNNIERAIEGALEMEVSLLYNSQKAYEALNKIESGLKQYPHNAFLYYFRGLIKEDKGEFQAAIVDFSNFLERKQNDYNGLFKLGFCNQNLKNFKKAIEYYDKSITYFSKISTESKLNPLAKSILPIEVIYNNRGVCKSNMGDIKSAIDDAEKAIKNNANYANAYFLKGTLWAKLGNAEKAIPSFKKSAELGFQPAIMALRMIGM